MASQSGKSRSSTGKSASSRTGSASKKKTTGKTTTRKTAARSASTRSASGSRKSSGSTRTSSSKKSSAQKTRSPLRAGGTALLVLAAVLVLLFAVGVRQGKIDVTSGNPISQFADFLMEDIGDDGGEDQPAADDDADREQPEITPETSVHTTTASAASDTTTAAATTAATTTTTAKESTTTTTTTTTAAKTTTTTKASTTAKTTTTTKATTTKATTTTTAAKVTEATDFSVVTTTAAQTTEPKPVYANAEYVADPNYESPYYIVVYAGKSQSVAIYTKDAGGKYSVLTRCFTCSTGAPETPTRTGQYKIRAKYRWRWLQGNVYGQYSSSISSSYLFHSVPYLKESESTLDMNEYDKLGTQASHGCIRLCIRDTKWIYDNCPIGTQVNIVNKSGPSGAGVPSLDYDSKYKGWDPTDPHPDNPYNN